MRSKYTHHRPTRSEGTALPVWGHLNTSFSYYQTQSFLPLLSIAAFQSSCSGHLTEKQPH